MNHLHQDENPSDPHWPYTPQTEDDQPKKQKRWPWIAGIVAALLVGVGIGSSGDAEPEIVTETETVTEEVEVEVEPADIQERRDEVSAAEDENETLGEELDQRAAELDQRESELDDREENISSTETEIEENTIPGSGTYRVGEDIDPGTYRTTGDSGYCYWARLAGYSGDINDIITNGNVEGQGFVTISDSDLAFETNGCGEWTRQ